jgi:hypothetical protein
MIRNGALICIAVMFAAIVPTGAAQEADRPSPGFADPVLGRWDIVVDGPDGPFPSWLEVRLRTEWQLMAQFVGQFGSARHATEVRFDDGMLTVRIPVQYENGDDDLVFSGTVGDDVLTGGVRTSDGRRLNWRGVRAPTLNRDDPPEQGEPVLLIGDDLSGWQPRDARYPGCWTVDDGVLEVTPPCVDIVSEERFRDFRLQLEFRYPPGSNSGVYLRGRYEVQIQDDFGKPLDPLRLGGVYGFLAPTVDAAKPSGEWQTYDIELIGRRVTVILNGTEILSNRVIPGITGGALDSDEGSPGPLMLQGDHGPIEYRNVVITPLH